MLPLLLIAAILILIWGVILIRQGGLVGGCLATIAAGSCFGHPFFNVSAVTLDRLMLVGLGAAYVIYRQLALIKPKPLGRPDVVLIAFALTLVYSTLSHDWRIDGAQPLATLLFFYMMPVGMYWVASRCNLTERSQQWVLGFFVLLGVYLSLTGICEVKEWSALVFPRYIMSADTTEFLGRARGPYLNPVGNGIYLSACLAATCLWWFRVQGRSRLLLAALALLNGVGLFCTLTRSVWLGAGVMLVALAALIVPPRHRARVVLASLIFATIAVTVSWSSLQQFKRDKHVSATEMAKSAGLRPILAAYAFEIFRDHPLTGCGFGQYAHTNVDYLTRRTFDVPMEKAKGYMQHNVFLSLLSETGLIGLTLFVVLLSLWSWDGWQLCNDGSRPIWQRQQGLFCLLVLVAYLANAMFHDLALIAMLNMLVFFVAGLTRSVAADRS